MGGRQPENKALRDEIAKHPLDTSTWPIEVFAQKLRETASLLRAKAGEMDVLAEQLEIKYSERPRA